MVAINWLTVPVKDEEEVGDNLMAFDALGVPIRIFLKEAEPDAPPVTGCPALGPFVFDIQEYYSLGPPWKYQVSGISQSQTVPGCEPSIGSSAPGSTVTVTNTCDSRILFEIFSLTPVYSGGTPEFISNADYSQEIEIGGAATFGGMVTLGSQLVVVRVRALDLGIDLTYDVAGSGGAYY
jgi:hypothetical protein